ncbi:MAG TPA: deoxyhypusine synthase family protein, partial [Candidatus Bathyarchaeia archaeon]|nr:deoxyhypusine synthase family protein [Candidatus Bathyarchaeia archaeon]
MPKKEHNARKEAVKDYELTQEMSVDELVRQMDKAWGFTAGKLASGVSIMESMINTKGCVKFLSFPADIVATGTRGVIKELVKQKLVDVLITTC